MKDFLKKYLSWVLVVILLIILIFFRSCNCGSKPTGDKRPGKDTTKAIKNISKATNKPSDQKIGNADLFTIDRFGAGTYVTAGKGGEIYVTHNGGINWVQGSSGSTIDLYSSAALGYETFIAAGDSGVILRSTDFGAAWVQVNSGTTKRIKSLSFPESNTGFASGESGLILKTIDGGLTWNSISVDSSYHITSVCFVNASTGWFTGKNGIIFRTDDSGVTWAPQVSGTLKNLNGISFNNPSTGTCVGEDGTILFTKNGGSSWSVKTTAFTGDLLGVHRASNTLAFIVGKGVILREFRDSLSYILSDTSRIFYAVDPNDPYIGGIAVGGSGNTMTVNTLVCQDCETGANHEVVFTPPAEYESSWKVRIRIYQDPSYNFKEYLRIITPGFELDNSAINGWTQFDGFEPGEPSVLDENTNGNFRRHNTPGGNNPYSNNGFVDAATLKINGRNTAYLDFELVAIPGNTPNTGMFEFYFGECPSNTVFGPCNLSNTEEMSFCHKVTYYLGPSQ